VTSPIDPVGPAGGDDSSDEQRPVPAAWGPASGVGSLPGTDPAEAVRLVVGELPDFAHLPELPARGPGADLIGRSAALLVDLAFDLTPGGWRLVPRSGIDQRRAEEFLARDLDALYDVADSWTGPFKVQAAGPWTLAAGLERTRGDRAVVDAGARRDLAQSLAEGLAAHVAAVAARVPGAQLVVQLDEPSVPAVLQGGLPTVSGFGKLPAVEATVVEQELADLVGRLPVPVAVHCCAPRMPLELFRAAGAAALSFDLGLVQDLDAVGTAIEAGTHLFPGVVPGTDATLPTPKATASRVQAWWRELGFPADDLAAAVTLTPSCGLAGATPAYARAAMAHVREAAKYLLPE
jgi:methionine synthase II (cobalamin-independent)